MKENHRTVRATDPASASHPALAARSNTVEIPLVETANLSPEIIQQKVSTKSKVLISMLQGDDTVHYTRHWGINE